ncbi:MAG: hypothetical protein IPJ58_07330 [Ardenticatenia bacterium]|nr:hypothetical protein [Ardenticatenia bacterium]
MTLRQTTQQLIAEAEALSGYPVEIKVDATLPTPAALRMARGSTALHTISIQPDPMAREGRDGTGRDGTGRDGKRLSHMHAMRLHPALLRRPAGVAL